VVNLPQAGFGYAGRVVESMAVGRPVLAYRVPNRPQTSELFEDGREILLYASPEELAGQIRRLQSDAGLRDRLVKEARRKLLQLHTSEKRVGQLFRWLEAGELPEYVKRL
jgi:glycosyltransferase involved in cell wall biosynthesis